MASSGGISDRFRPHAATGGSGDSFVGIKLLGNEVHFYYPEAYRLEPGCRNDVLDILRTVAAAKAATRESSGADDARRGEGEFALLSYLWLISDFLRNGFYTPRERRLAVNRPGRIDWRRTIEGRPVVSRGNIIYPEIRAWVRSPAESMITEIHRYAVRTSIDLIGWLFGLEPDFIEVRRVTPEVKRRYLAAIDGELRRTFDDVKRQRLRHMESVLLGLNAREGREELAYGVDSYAYCFERMVDSVFGSVRDLREFYPRGVWHLTREGYRPALSTELRPDTVLIRGGDAFVIDAKFYRFGVTGRVEDLPETSSIQKQVTYGDFLRRNAVKFGIERVYSAFILPFNKEGEVFKTDEDLVYIGAARPNWRGAEAGHEVIHTFLVDLKSLIKSSRRGGDREAESLAREIEARQAEISNFI